MKIKSYNIIISIIIIFLLFVSNTMICLKIEATENNHEASYDLLIITPKHYVKSLQPLIRHKNNVGIKTKLVCLNDVYDEIFWKGRDRPEKIKYFIKKSIEEWNIKYVLLVGDHTKIPVRYVYNSFLNNPYTPPEEKFISELYYADIYDVNHNFSSWDTNNNGIYGEWKGESAEDKNIDLRPEIAVGRLPCKNNIEVKIMVNKIIYYETKIYGQPWFKRILLVGGDTAPESLNPNWTGYEGEDNINKVIQNMSGFEPIQLLTSDGTFSKPWDIIKKVNQGCGFFYLEGHANPFSWGTYAPNATDWIDELSIFNMIFLHNMRKTPICIVGGCQSLKFDMTLPIKCWGWKLTSKMIGGSIATIGCTAEWMIKEDKQSQEGAGDFLNQIFFWEYGMNGTDILGEAMCKAINKYLDIYHINWDTPRQSDYAIDAKTVQEWTLFGDPTIKIGGYNVSC